MESIADPLIGVAACSDVMLPLEGAEKLAILRRMRKAREKEEGRNRNPKTNPRVIVNVNVTPHALMGKGEKGDEKESENDERELEKTVELEKGLLDRRVSMASTQNFG